jgi:hypothetical protein
MPGERLNRRPRGIVLNDLDRGLVWRIGYVGRRWEILGSEAEPGCGLARQPAAQRAEPHGGRAPRHAAPESPSQQG